MPFHDTLLDPNEAEEVGSTSGLRLRVPPPHPAPIKKAPYLARPIKPGATYVVAIVAMERATPPNRSAASNRVQETAR